MNDLTDELRRRLGMNHIVVMECTLFHVKRSSCPGLNAGILSRIVCNFKFKDWMKVAKSNIARDLTIKRVENPSGEPNLDIVMVCRSGKRRSVACAELLAFVLAELRWKVYVEHIHHELWGECKGDCQRCQKCAHVMNDALELALTTWKMF